jgi:hypothetical protein
VSYVLEIKLFIERAITPEQQDDFVCFVRNYLPPNQKMHTHLRKAWRDEQMSMTERKVHFSHGEGVLCGNLYQIPSKRRTCQEHDVTCKSCLRQMQDYQEKP